jgi:hypothetical protein
MFFRHTLGYGRNIRDEHVGELIRHTALLPIGRAIPVTWSACLAALPSRNSLGFCTQVDQKKQGDDCEWLFHIVRFLFSLNDRTKVGERLAWVSAEIRVGKNQGFLRGRGRSSFFASKNNPCRYAYRQGQLKIANTNSKGCSSLVSHQCFAMLRNRSNSKLIWGKSMTSRSQAAMPILRLGNPFLSTGGCLGGYI